MSIATKSDRRRVRPISLPQTGEPTPSLLPLNQIAKGLVSAKTGGQVDPATVARWIVRGAPDGNGVRHHLRAVRTPLGWQTTREWVAAFFEELGRGRVDREPASVRSPAARSRSDAAAARKLDQLGVHVD